MILCFLDKDLDVFSFLKYVLAGKLEKGAVLKAICSGFEETTEPAVCLSGGKFFLLVWYYLTEIVTSWVEERCLVNQ